MTRKRRQLMAQVKARVARAALREDKTLAKLAVHLDGILAYCKHRVTNGVTGGINSTLMTLKRLAGSYGNIDNFKTAIYFHCGGLDLHPRKCRKSPKK